VTLPRVGAYRRTPRWQTNKVSSGSIFVFPIQPEVRVVGHSSVLLRFGSHPLVFGFLQISLEGSLISRVNHSGLRVLIDLNKVICLFIWNEFIMGVFSKKNILGTLMPQILEPNDS